MLELLFAEASTFPWVGYVETSFPNPTAGPGGLEIGTGSLIAPCVVLTAAHIVYDPDQGGQARSVAVTFGGQQGLRIISAQVDFPVQWRNPRSDFDGSILSPVDIGVIILPEAIDRFIRPMPFQTASDAMLAGMSVNVAGYPAFPPEGFRGTLWGRNGNVLQGSVLGDLHQYEDFRLFYPVGTLPGMSGGPLYHLDPVSNIRTIHGIHTSFVNGLGGTALRINEDIYQLILEWVGTFRP